MLVCGSAPLFFRLSPDGSAARIFQLQPVRSCDASRAGYCFRTPRAIQYFGNEGCRYTSEAQIRFPPDVRRRIQEIIRLERAMNCPR